ncbi:hypothetical protein ACGC1H_007071 [Rhizoctonia solani]
MKSILDEHQRYLATMLAPTRLFRSSQRVLINSGCDREAVSTSNNKAVIRPKGNTNQVTDHFEKPDTWEQEIGLDEVIEQPESGLRYSFEVTETDGINLNAPALLDLLSDEPVDRALEFTTNPVVRKPENMSEGSKDK